jgi:hypothetical protein
MGVNRVTEVLNWATAAAVLSTLVGLLPPFVALLGGIYYIILIYESKTLKEWRQKRRERRLAILKAKIATIEAKTPAPKPL